MGANGYWNEPHVLFQNVSTIISSPVRAKSLFVYLSCHDAEIYPSLQVRATACYVNINDKCLGLIDIIANVGIVHHTNYNS